MNEKDVNVQEQIISIDAGGSGCRFIYKRGNRKFKKSMVSRLRKINEDSAVFNDLEDPTEDFEIRTDLIPETKGRYVRGMAGQDHKGGVSIQPDNQGLKVNQTITYINILHATAKALLPLKAKDPVDVTVGIVIPASEFCSDKNLVDIPKEYLSKGIHEVYFPVLNRSVKFYTSKANVKVGGEGMVFAMNLKIDPKYSQHKTMFETSDGLIIDVGRRSSDLTPFRKGKPVKKAARSFPIGGIQIEANVSADLEIEGRPVSNEDIINVIADGAVAGQTIAPSIKKAKKVLAGSVREGITTVMAQAETSTRNQSYVVLIGQPFIEDQGMSPTNVHYKGSLANDILESFPNNITVIKPDNQEFANCEAMLDLLIKTSGK